MASALDNFEVQAEVSVGVVKISGVKVQGHYIWGRGDPVLRFPISQSFAAFYFSRSLFALGRSTTTNNHHILCSIIISNARPTHSK